MEILLPPDRPDDQGPEPRSTRALRKLAAVAVAIGFWIHVAAAAEGGGRRWPGIPASCLMGAGLLLSAIVSSADGKPAGSGGGRSVWGYGRRRGFPASALFLAGALLLLRVLGVALKIW